MDSIFDGIDMSDPCSVYPKLQKVLYSLLAGEGVARSKFGEEEVQFWPADIKKLELKIADLKAQCQAKNTGGTTRRAFRCGW